PCIPSCRESCRSPCRRCFVGTSGVAYLRCKHRRLSFKRARASIRLSYSKLLLLQCSHAEIPLANLGEPCVPDRRKIEGNTALEERFGPVLDLALRVRHQEQRQRGPKVYSLHAPEVECIGRGKARAPYEFGCKVSIATPVTAPKGGQFVLHAKALHGNPYDGHTLGPVIADLEKLTGVT